MIFTRLVIADNRAFLNRKSALKYLNEEIEKAPSECEKSRLMGERAVVLSDSPYMSLPQATPRPRDYPLNILTEVDLFDESEWESVVLPDDFAVTLDYVLLGVEENVREIFYCRYKEGMKLDAIAEKCGHTREYVNTRLRKAARHLRGHRKLLRDGIRATFHTLNEQVDNARVEIRDLNDTVEQLRERLTELASADCRKRQPSNAAPPLDQQEEEFKNVVFPLASTRLMNVLFRKGIVTKTKLLGYDQPFSRIRGCGRKTFDELQGICQTLGWEFEGVW